MFSKLILCSILIVTVSGCANEKCPAVPAHYEELGCEAVKDADGCCIISFKCPDFEKLDKTKCYYKGKEYNATETLNDELASHCMASCVCHGDSHVSFQCASVECPEDLNGRNWDCVLQYESLKSCCASNEICDKAKIDNLTQCHVNGKTYRAGEEFEPVNGECRTCLCTSDFDNSTKPSENAKCTKIDCGIELHAMEKIQNGCAPVYYGSSGCCPINYICPSGTDRIIGLKTRTRSNQNATEELSCRFGNNAVHIGEQIQVSDKSLECKCEIPPLLTCIKNNK